MPRYRRRGRNLPPSLGGGIIPTMALSTSSVSLTATAGDTAVKQSVVTVTSGNGGTLAGVGIGTVTEDNGSGWLSATVQGGFPALVTVVCDATSLTAGTYTGSILVLDARASNSPRTISVTFAVSAAVVPSIVLQNPTLTLTVQQGNAATDSATCTVTSGTAAGLGTLSIGSVTGTGSTGVSATVSGNLVTVTGASAALTSASSPYSATVPVVDATASNTPQNITVTLNVTAVSPPATPTMALSSPSVSWTVTEGTSATRAVAVTVTASNGATLGTTSVGTITGTGAADVSASVSGHVVTVSLALATLAAGNYTATVPIIDSLADNSPQNFTVNLAVEAAPAATYDVNADVHLLASTPGIGVLVAGGFPLRQGDLTTTDITNRKFAVFVGGIEQACSVVAHPGRYPDGTVRSVELQFYYDIPNTTPISAQVKLRTVRTTTDIARVSMDPTVCWKVTTGFTWGAEGEIKAKLLPRDPSYLCSADITFEPLLPAASQDAVETARLDTFFGQRLAALKAQTNPTYRDTQSVRFYQATYESSRAMLASWCRTGNVTHYQDAMQTAYRLLEYTNNALSAAKPSPSTNVFGETRMVSTDGNIYEPYSLRYISYAACWQLSGYAPFFAAVNGQHMNQNYSARATSAGANVINNTSTGGYISSVYLPRYNMVRMWPHLIAYAIGANRRQSTQSGFGNRDMNFPVELPLIIGALVNATYAKGDYRDGLTGCYQDSTDGMANQGTGTGAVPNFQLNYVNALYMFYEREVYADPRIPALIKANTDVILANTKPSTVGSRGYGYTDAGYGTTYWANPTTAGQPASDYLGYSAGSLAYCAARYPNTTVNGATYEVWYTRAMDFKNVGYTTGTLKDDWDKYLRGMKILGEAFGFQQASPYHIRNGVPTGAPQINSLSVITQWPGV